VADTGWKLPTAVSQSSTSAKLWANNSGQVTLTPVLLRAASPANATSIRVGTLSPVESASEVLTVTGFDFSAIPSGATITDVAVRPLNYRDQAVNWNLVRITKDGSTQVGTNLAATPVEIPTTFTETTFSGNLAAWGVTLTASEVKASTFGFALRVIGADPDFYSICVVESVESRITYTPAASAPTVTSCDPSSGSTAGGTAVTITGTGLTNIVTAYFGGVAATSFTVVNSTTITCVTPAGSAGSCDVGIETAGGAFYTALVNGFTYVSTSQTSRTLLTESGLPLFADQGGRLMIEGSGSGAGLKRLLRVFEEE